ncbi:MAG: hypothetical protein M3161_03850 [Actinomycetota bacterium]|nr:hypothetical protein [Actinomycetota bacterium]
MKRALLGSIAAVLVVGAAPASAQSGARAAVTAPSDGALIGGTTSVRGTGSAAAGVRSIQLFVHDTLVASRDPSELRQDVDVDYAWNTTHLPGSSQLAPNGWYQIKVRVVSNEGGEAVATRNVRVDNGAAAPTGLTVRTSRQTVTLSWNANPEPDIAGYRIEYDGGGGFATLATTKSTDYSYNAAPGTYAWRVIALRNSPSEPNGRASAPSDVVAASIAASSGSSGGAGNARPGGNGGAHVGELFGGNSKAARRHVRATRRAFASLGISRAGISLPGIALGLPRLPDDEFEWGTYKGKLPYGTPQQDTPIASEPVRLAARSTSAVMPLDALQWLAAGILMVVIAGLFQFLALQTKERATG